MRKKHLTKEEYEKKIAKPVRKVMDWKELGRKSRDARIEWQRLKIKHNIK
tara:strand:+ start:967 stop:1116 length:150 start_codon:yes stop_codon:yes gene_type:complete